jgi:hypothetical protein
MTSSPAQRLKDVWQVRRTDVTPSLCLTAFPLPALLLHPFAFAAHIVLSPPCLKRHYIVLAVSISCPTHLCSKRIAISHPFLNFKTTTPDQHSTNQTQLHTFDTAPQEEDALRTAQMTDDSCLTQDHILPAIKWLRYLHRILGTNREG